MQKPDYVKIILPCGRGQATPEVKRFFNRLHNQILDVQFSKQRVRKVFKYKVAETSEFKAYFNSGIATKDKFKITLLRV